MSDSLVDEHVTVVTGRCTNNTGACNQAPDRCVHDHVESNQKNRNPPPEQPHPSPERPKTQPSNPSRINRQRSTRHGCNHHYRCRYNSESSRCPATLLPETHKQWQHYRPKGPGEDCVRKRALRSKLSIPY